MVIYLVSVLDVNEDATGRITIRFQQEDGQTQLTNLRASSADEARQWARVLSETAKALSADAAAPPPAPRMKSALKCAEDGCEKWKVSGQKYCKSHTGSADQQSAVNRPRGYTHVQSMR